MLDEKICSAKEVSCELSIDPEDEVEFPARTISSSVVVRFAVMFWNASLKERLDA